MQKKRAFTLLEVLIVIFVLATGIMVVIQGVNKTTSYISESAQRTIALNLAKEGIEAVYNIRNTNWRKWPNQKDECWLVANHTEVNGNKPCVEAKKLTGDNYFSLVRKRGEVKTVSFERAESPSNFDYTFGWLSKNQFSHYGNIFNVLEFVDRQVKYDDPSNWNKLTNLIVYYPDRKERISLYDFTTDDILKNDLNAVKAKIDWRYGRYYRDIVVLGMNPKTNLNKICRRGSRDTECDAPGAKEFRFCSVVVYTYPHQGIVNICSMMTNFEKSSSEI